MRTVKLFRVTFTRSQSRSHQVLGITLLAGVVLSLKGDTFTSYEIDFTDTSMGRQQRFQDATQYTIAAMSDTGAIFASPGEYEDTPTLLGVLEKQQVSAVLCLSDM